MPHDMVDGFVHDRFAPVRALFEAGNLAKRGRTWGPHSAPRWRETVVDLWGGFADAAKTRPWEEFYDCQRLFDHAKR